MLRWVDRHPWSVPVSIFVLATVIARFSQPLFGVTASFTCGPLRQQVYSSLTGASSALLGFLIAAVTILAAFGKRPTTTLADQHREEALALARMRLVLVLLAAAFFMLVVLVTASIALASSNYPDRLNFADATILGGVAAGVAGILYGGLGLGLAVAERAR